MIGLHGVLLLGDKWLRPGIGGIALPFVIPYRPLWVGLGIVAGYLAALLGPTYFVRRRIGTRRWRSLHRATVAVYALSAHCRSSRCWRFGTALHANAAPPLGLGHPRGRLPDLRSATPDSSSTTDVAVR